GCDPRAEIQGRTLLLVDLSNAEVVSEVGPAAMCAAVSGDGGQPVDRCLQERNGRKNDAMKAGECRLQDSIDQRHVVKVRQPADGNAFRAQFETVPKKF